jgi:3-hydroxyacyl-CoA dehydrogenase/3a,7a,12a-trihydroxy-5b-cholest-24-enoyl-CoA hydratase
MTQANWDAIYRVHLLGAFSVTRAAWNHMREQGYGRIIMTSSASGLYGNFGQANYSACKMGLVGLASTLAKEGKSKNILVNTIAPIARSRMTEKLLPQEVLKKLTPESVAPLVVYLCHESNTETGSVFELGAGWYAKVAWKRAPGFALPEKNQTPEGIQKGWEEINKFDVESSMQIPTGLQDTVQAMFTKLQSSL